MKKIVLVLVSLLFYLVSTAQNVSVNVHVYGGNERLYFKHPHSWMINHGYHYHRGGYYVRNGVRMHPVRREYYGNKSNNGRRNHGYGNPKNHRKNNGHGKYQKRGKGHR